MWSKTLIKCITSVIFVFACKFSFAGSETVIIETSGGSDLVDSAIGVWSYNGRISFSGSETSYRVLFSDIGIGGEFDYLGGAISSATGVITEFDFNVGGSDIQQFDFDIEAGDYWLTLFAITDSATNIGTLGLDFQLQSEVPLPASAWMMLSAIGALGLMKRKSLAKKLK